MQALKPPVLEAVLARFGSACQKPFFYYAPKSGAIAGALKMQVQLIGGQQTSIIHARIGGIRLGDLG
jgi:hypothetical protein